MDDDEQLADIKVRYAKGELLSGEVKAVLIKVLQDFTKMVQDARNKVTDADVAHYTAVRKIEKMPTKWLADKAALAPQAEAGVTLYSDTLCNMQTKTVEMAADLASAHIKTQVCVQATRQDLAKKAKIQGAPFPYFQLDD